MWPFPTIRLTIPQRLALLTLIPVLGLVGAGGMSFQTFYAEYKSFAEDAKGFIEFRHELDAYLTLARQLAAERDAALRLPTQSNDPKLVSDFQLQISRTDQVVAALMAKLDRLEASPRAKIFATKSAAVRSFFASQLPEARNGALQNKHTAGEVFFIYTKLSYSALSVTECYRQFIQTPAGLNMFDALRTVLKIHLQEDFAITLALHGLQHAGLKGDQLAILRRQFFDSTENEYYMLQFLPELRAYFKATTRKTEDDAAFYQYLIDLASRQVEDRPLPTFVPKSQSLAELVRAHFAAYDEVYNRAFSIADSTLMEIARQRQHHAYFIGVSLLIGIGLSLGASLAITRSTRKSLVAVSTTIALASDDVKAASKELTSAGDHIARDAHEYAYAIERIGATLDEISTVADTNKSHAAKATATTDRTRDSVSAGLGTIKELDQVMTSARDSAQKINQIISRINDISFQTNLLALNAAVEAARAGEAGAGFAVVADEVRRLAARCADAAKETTELIGDSSKDTAIAIRKSDELAGRFKTVSLGISELSEIVTSISANFIQQAGSIAEITQSVSDQRRIAQNMAAAAEETASTACSMESQVESLRTSVDRLDNLLGTTTAQANEAQIYGEQQSDGASNFSTPDSPDAPPVPTRHPPAAGDHNDFRADAGTAPPRIACKQARAASR